MAQWPVEPNWTHDVVAENLRELKRVTCFRASKGMFLPVLIDLYSAEAVIAGKESPVFHDVCEAVSKQLIGQIMLEALVVDDHSVVRFEMESRIYV